MRLRVAENDDEQVITLTLTQNENEVSVDIKAWISKAKTIGNSSLSVLKTTNSYSLVTVG